MTKRGPFRIGDQVTAKRGMAAINGPFFQKGDAFTIVAKNEPTGCYRATYVIQCTYPEHRAGQRITTDSSAFTRGEVDLGSGGRRVYRRNGRWVRG